MLATEYKDTIDSVRSLFGNFIGWFTFFTGVNLAGYGWFAKQLVDNAPVARWVILIVCIYFVFQHVVAWYATDHLTKYLIGSQSRLEQILPEIAKTSEAGMTPQIGCPLSLYIISVRSMRATFPSMVFLWAAFTVFAFTKPSVSSHSTEASEPPSASVRPAVPPTPKATTAAPPSPSPKQH